MYHGSKDTGFLNKTHPLKRCDFWLIYSFHSFMDVHIVLHYADIQACVVVKYPQFSSFLREEKWSFALLPSSIIYPLNSL